MGPGCDSAPESEIVRVLLVEQLVEVGHVVLTALETIAELLEHELNFVYALEGHEIAL